MNAMPEPLPSSSEIKNLYPLSLKQKRFIARSQKIAREVLLGTDQRLVIFSGPCSIHHFDSAIAYAKRFKQLSERVNNKYYLIMRAYIEKPRTSIGWKGFVYDPDLDGSHDLLKGIHLSRKLFLALADLEVPIATEFLDPFLSYYFDDLVTWGFIGARTPSSQIHRQLASQFSFPFGFKNTIEGCVDTAINAVSATNRPHTFFGLNSHGVISKIKSSGNPYAHVVLRGSSKKSNYDKESINQLVLKMEEKRIRKQFVIDCAHGNCQKDFKKQQHAFFSILETIKEENFPIIGIMLESFLKEGRYSIEAHKTSPVDGLSITDGCLDWTTTEKLILWAHSSISTTPVV